MADQTEMPEQIRSELPSLLEGTSIEGIQIAGVLRPGTTALTFKGIDEFGYDCVVKLVPRSSYGEQAPLAEIARLVEADRRHLVVPDVLREVRLKIREQDHDFLFFKSRRVRGLTLEEFLASGTAFPPSEEVSRFIKHLHTALDQLERLDLNHGDLHGRNIIREVVGQDGPDPEVRYVVIDFSEAHDSSKLKPGCTWDVEMLGRHLAEFYRIISLRENLTRQDEEVLTAIQRLPGQTQRKGTEEPAITRAADVSVQYFDALRHLQQRPRQLTNPFDAWSAEYIPNDALLVALCHVESPALKDLLETPGNVVLCGPRGTGKSTLFRRFRFLTKVTAADEMDDIREELMSDQYAAFYIPCEALVNLRFAGLGDADVKQNADALRTYFNLAVFAEISRGIGRLPKDLGPISECTKGKALDLLKREAGGLWSALQLDNLGHTWQEMEKAAFSVMRAIQATVARSSEPAPVGTQNDFIYQLVEVLQEGIPGLSHRHFIVFLDDYTDERVPVSLQEELDHILTHRSSNVSFKISSHMFGSIYTSTSKSAPDEWRNFTPYDLGWHYLNRPAKERDMLLEILDKRISNSTSLEGTIEEWLGHRSLSGGRSLAYALWDPETRDSSLYYGVETLMQMCTGDFSEMIRMAHRIFKHAGIEPGTPPHMIDPRAQNSAVVEFSREHLVAVQYIVPYGERLYDIVRAFGEYSKRCLRERALIQQSRDSDRSEPYRTLTAYVENLRSADPDTLRLWQALQKASLFVNAQSAPSRTGSIASRATFRRLLAPAFSLPFTESEHLSLRPADFELWMKQPTDWFRVKFRDTMRAAGADPLFEDLRTTREDEVNLPEVPVPELDVSRLQETDWKARAPHPWGAAVAELPDLEKLSEAQSRACEYDLVVAAVGFEERTTGALSVLAQRDSRIQEVIALEIGKYPTATQVRRVGFNELVRKATGGKPPIPTSSPVDHQDSRFFDRFVETLESLSASGGRIAFDITSCPSLVLTQALDALLSLECDLSLLYTEPQKYLPLADELALEEGAERRSRYLPFTGVRFVATPPRLQGSDNAQLPLAAVVFPTFSAERIGKAIKEIEPAKQIWLFGEPLHGEKNGFQLDLTRQESRTLLRPDDSFTMTSRFDYRQTMLALGGIYAEYRHDFRIVLIPHGSKLQTVGALLFRWIHDSLSFVFAMPQNYDPTRFSEGIGDSWYLRLGDTRLLASMLRESRVVGGRPHRKDLKTEEVNG